MEKKYGESRNSLTNLTNEQLEERLCYDCYNDYILNDSTLSKYQGGGEFLRYTWRLRKNIQRHFPGCPSRLISSILSRCWKYMPITRHLLRTGDPRLCCHCGQLKRVIQPEIYDNEESSILHPLKRYDNLSLIGLNNFKENSPEELEWMLIKNKFTHYRSKNDLTKSIKTNNTLKIALNNNNQTYNFINNKVEYDPTKRALDYEFTSASHTQRDIPEFKSDIKLGTGNILGPINNVLPSNMMSVINMDPSQSLSVEPLNEKNLLLCILNNVSTGNECRPDDSCITSKSDSRF